MTRLDVQRQPVRFQVRRGVRKYIRGYTTKPAEPWGNRPPGKAEPGAQYPPEPTVTAQDSTNAAKLAGLGYVAVPTSNWTTGQAITVGTFKFNWTGAAWAAGVHA